MDTEMHVVEQCGEGDQETILDNKAVQRRVINFDTTEIRFRDRTSRYSQSLARQCRQD
jgi:hypothetical protein